MTCFYLQDQYHPVGFSTIVQVAQASKQLLRTHFKGDSADLKDLILFLCTQKAYFSQILFTNLSKSVLVSTSPLPKIVASL